MLYVYHTKYKIGVVGRYNVAEASYRQEMCGNVTVS